MYPTIIVSYRRSLTIENFIPSKKMEQNELAISLDRFEIDPRRVDDHATRTGRNLAPCKKKYYSRIILFTREFHSAELIHPVYPRRMQMRIY